MNPADGHNEPMAAAEPPPPRPAALLLTGGASRRMGTDKASLVVGGQRLAERTAALLVLLAAPVLEVGPGFTALPCTRESPPGSGPLAAVAAGGAALEELRHRGPVLVVATDLPQLSASYLRRLAEQSAPTPAHCVVPRDADGEPQPLCARYSVEALAQARELVAAGHRSMRALLAVAPVMWLDAGTDGALLDVDTPADLERLRR